MASHQRTVDYIVDQIAPAGVISARRLFGEYGIYCDGKLVALICDDQFFVKKTAAGRALLGDVKEAPPYKGTKPWFVAPGDQWDDADWLAALVRASASELPAPGNKRKATQG